MSKHKKSTSGKAHESHARRVSNIKNAILYSIKEVNHRGGESRPLGGAPRKCEVLDDNGQAMLCFDLDSMGKYAFRPVGGEIHFMFEKDLFFQSRSFLQMIAMVARWYSAHMAKLNCWTPEGVDRDFFFVNLGVLVDIARDFRGTDELVEAANEVAKWYGLELKSAEDACPMSAAIHFPAFSSMMSKIIGREKS